MKKISTFAGVRPDCCMGWVAEVAGSVGGSTGRFGFEFWLEGFLEWSGRKCVFGVAYMVILFDVLLGPPGSGIQSTGILRIMILTERKKRNIIMESWEYFI